MNKKGVFGISGEFILILIIVLVVLGTLYFGIWKRAEGIAKEKLPAGEKLKLLVDKFTTSPGEAERQRQEDQANNIATAIKSTINKMNDIDCIEQIDYSKIEDKDFTLEFKEEDGKSKLQICKMIGKPEQCGPIFPYDFNMIIYYSVIKSSETASIEDVTEFKINNLQEIEFNKEKEKLNSFLYKNKEEKIIFSSNIFYPIYKVKQICSDGEYLGDIDFNNYDKVIISESRHTINNKDNELDIKRKLYLGSFKKYEGLWYKEGFEDKSPIYNDENMVKIINLLRKAKFRVELI